MIPHNAQSQRFITLPSLFLVMRSRPHTIYFKIISVHMSMDRQHVINNNMNMTTYKLTIKKIKTININMALNKYKIICPFHVFLSFWQGDKKNCRFWTTTACGWSMWSIWRNHRQSLVMSIWVNYIFMLWLTDMVAFVCAHVTRNIQAMWQWKHMKTPTVSYLHLHLYNAVAFTAWAVHL